MSPAVLAAENTAATCTRELVSHTFTWSRESVNARRKPHRTSVRSRPHGRLRVAGTPIHQRRTYQLWRVEIRRPDDDKLVASGPVRLQNLEANS